VNDVWALKSSWVLRCGLGRFEGSQCPIFSVNQACIFRIRTDHCDSSWRRTQYGVSKCRDYTPNDTVPTSPQHVCAEPRSRTKQHVTAQLLSVYSRAVCWAALNRESEDHPKCSSPWLPQVSYRCLFSTSPRQEGLVLGINNFLFYFIVTSDTLLSGPVPLCCSFPTVFLSLTQYSMLL